MNTLFWIIASTFLISLISWIGSLTLFLKKEVIDKILLILVAFSAGGMMGGAFLHLLPEAIIEIGADPSATLGLFLYLILGFCVFFILEQFIEWYHEHTDVHQKRSASYLVLLSDLIHNFIDGLVIAGSFTAGFNVGIVTTLAIALHEIPQEIGDFGILVYGGFKRIRALFWNYASAVTVVFGGVAGYYLSAIIDEATVLLLPFAAGNFIYIAASDLIPEIKHGEKFERNLLHFFIFVIGILLMLGMKTFKQN